jgi:hypothetical protein
MNSSLSAPRMSRSKLMWAPDAAPCVMVAFSSVVWKAAVRMRATPVLEWTVAMRSLVVDQVDRSARADSKQTTSPTVKVVWKREGFEGVKGVFGGGSNQRML